MCAGWGIPFHRTPLIVGALLAIAYSSSVYADDQTAEMRALLKAQSDKLDEQAKVLADQARLIREQSEFLERQRQALKGIIPASIQPQENATGGSLPEVMETINLSTSTKPQEGEDAPGTKKEKSKDTPLKVVWGKDGRLMFKSEDRNFVAHLGGFFQLDASFYSVSDSVQQLLPDRGLLEGSDMRRARLRSDGVCWNVVEWVMEMDFSRASDTTKDIISDPVPNVYINNMYIGLRDLPVFGNVRVGHIKEDLSFYNASSGRNIPFMERPNVWDAIEDPYIFDNGIMMSRTYLDDLLYVSLGLFMTNTRTGAFTVSASAPLAFDVRVCYMPIYDEEDQHWMNIGATGSVRANPTSGEPNFRLLLPMCRLWSVQEFHRRCQIFSIPARFIHVKGPSFIRCVTTIHGGLSRWVPSMMANFSISRTLEACLGQMVLCQTKSSLLETFILMAVPSSFSVSSPGETTAPSTRTFPVMVR